MQTTFSVEHQQEAVIVHILPHDVKVVDALSVALTFLFSTPSRRIALDLYLVQTLSCDAMKKLRAVARKAKAQGVRLFLCDLEEQAEFLLRFTGTKMLFETCETVNDVLLPEPEVLVEND